MPTSRNTIKRENAGFDRNTGVFLSLDEYEKLLERAEDVEALDMLRKMREKPLETRSFDDFLEESSLRD
jgi:hypothetical protein